MKYLPFENIIYKTNLKPDEVTERIQQQVEPRKTFRMTGIFGSNDHKPYEGEVGNSNFNITRIIGYRNSFLPRISGNIENDYIGSKILVKMRLHPFVMVFLFIWCGGVTLALVAALTSSINSGTLEPWILAPLGMLLFAYALTTGAFKYESIKSKKYLAELLDAEIIE